MWIMPQIAMMNVLTKGVAELKANPAALDEIFNYMYLDEFSSLYGSGYVEQIKAWFAKTKIPVIHAWGMSADRVPCISIHLSSENEDEAKAAMGDYLGDTENETLGVAVFNVNLDIGIFASKTGDQVLWLYYIASYILFKYKRELEKLGLHLQSYSTSDWDRKNEYNIENVWTRWIRFRCTTHNQWNLDTKQEYDVFSDVYVESEVDLEDPINIDGD